jgi:hypothetical protein
VKTRQNDSHAETVVLPQDELAIRRKSRPASHQQALTVQQVQRLLAAAESRKKTDRRD